MMRRRMPFHWATAVVAICALAVLQSACASGGNELPPGAAEADKFLVERGTAALKDRKWLVARENFTRLIDSYPQSPLRADAKLGVGDAYLGENTAQSLVLATNEYREFLAFYPTSPRADYAQFQLGMVHFNQMLAPDRDQTETKEAIREFATFVERYPNSELLPQGRSRLREAKDRLGDSDLRVGITYLRIHWPSGAIERFKGLLESDPGYTNKDALYYNLAEALVMSEKTAEALPYYERLLQEFEKSEFLDRARRRVDELKAKSGQSY